MKNDKLVKLLFALQIAVLPLVVFGEIVLNFWLSQLFILLLLVAKLWQFLLSEKYNNEHKLLNTITTFLIVSFLMVYYGILGFVKVGVIIPMLILMLVFLLSVIFKKYFPRNELSKAVDTCVYIFAYITVVFFGISSTVHVVGLVGAFGTMLACILSLGIKLYCLIKIKTYKIGKLKNSRKRK